MLYKNNTTTIKKYSFYAILALSIHTNDLLSNTPTSEQSIISTYQDVNGPWKLLEYIFITKPQAELHSFMEHYFSAPLGIAGTIVVAKALFIDPAPNPHAKLGTYSHAKNLLLATSAVAAGKMSYNFIECYAKRSIQKKTLLALLSNWNIYREHIPHSLVDYFDTLEAQSKNCSFVLTNSIIADVFGLVSHHLEHHFENRYKKPEPKSMSNMEAFKNGIEMWKS